MSAYFCPPSVFNSGRRPPSTFAGSCRKLSGHHSSVNHAAANATTVTASLPALSFLTESESTMAAAVKAHSSPQPKCESETLILEIEGAAMCQSAIAQSNWSKLVKSGKKVKDWSKERGLIANIDIFGCLCKFGLQD
ncbi:hypothetical protein DEO72_LG5g1642 [Vigna unguiculata]|uniref:Uncharacterized protein n=1 Tax=Vigna unguiculata TaxID=3917 RepID=A0A4D6LXZ1_VIGUN|nr:hypothetical protein DEO72_LG5g1642 [Vigna unguiculata]